MTDQSTMYCMICGAVAPCDAHTYHGQAPCRSNPMPETTLPEEPALPVILLVLVVLVLAWWAA